MSTYDLNLYLPILDQSPNFSLYLLNEGEIAKPGQDFTEFVLDTKPRPAPGQGNRGMQL